METTNAFNPISLNQKNATKRGAKRKLSYSRDSTSVTKRKRAHKSSLQKSSSSIKKNCHGEQESKKEEKQEEESFLEKNKDDEFLCFSSLGGIDGDAYKLESEFLAQPDYLEHQPHLEPSYRKRLLNWLCPVAKRYQLDSNCIYLAVNLIDRYLSQNKVKAKQLQMFGAAALLLASKYHDVKHINVGFLVRLCDGAFKKDDLLDCESKMLCDLDYSLTLSTSFYFLNRYLLQLRNASVYDLVEKISLYLNECLLVDEKFIGFLPSLHASISIFWAIHLTKKELWTKSLKKLLRNNEEIYLSYSDAILRAGFPKFKTCGVQKCHFGRSSEVERIFRSKTRKDYVLKIIKKQQLRQNKLQLKQKKEGGEVLCEKTNSTTTKIYNCVHIEKNNISVENKQKNEKELFEKTINEKQLFEKTTIDKENNEN